MERFININQLVYSATCYSPEDVIAAFHDIVKLHGNYYQLISLFVETSINDVGNVEVDQSQLMCTDLLIVRELYTSTCQSYVEQFERNQITELYIIVVSVHPPEPITSPDDVPER